MAIEMATVADALGISNLILPLTIEDIIPTCEEPALAILTQVMSATAIKGYIEKGFEYDVIKDQTGAIIAVIGLKENTHLYHLFVARPHQGGGLATKLWQHAKTRSIARGNTVGFTVNSALNAQGIYRRFGFSPSQGIRNRGGILDIPMRLDL